MNASFQVVKEEECVNRGYHPGLNDSGAQSADSGWRKTCPTGRITR